MGKIVFSTNGAGDKWISTCKRIKLDWKMDHRTKCKTQNYKISRRKYRSKSSWPQIRHDTKSTRDKIKGTLDFIKIRNFMLWIILSRKMVMDVNQTSRGDHFTSGDHFTTYTTIEPLCCAPETNIVPYVYDTSI